MKKRLLKVQKKKGRRKEKKNNNQCYSSIVCNSLYTVVFCVLKFTKFIYFKLFSDVY